MNEFAWIQLMPIAPELTLVAGALLLLMLGVFSGPRGAGAVHGLSVLLLAGIAVGILYCPTLPHGMLFNKMVLVDSFSQAMKVIILAAASLALLAGRGWLLKGSANRAFEYPVLVLLAVVGLMLMTSANDFLALYVALELSSLALYVLAAFQRDSMASSEAGVKYFVLGALASGLLLFGISLLYGYTGSTNFAAISQLLAENQLTTPAAFTAPYLGVAFGMVLVLIALSFKVSAVPFHMWTPDVYHGAPTAITAFFAGAPKVAGLALFARVLVDALAPLQWQWAPIILAISAGSMLVGAWGALTQSNIKRLLAYSSIGHVGYVLLALAVANEAAMKGLLVYLALYAATGIGAFAVLLKLSTPEKSVEELSDVAGLSQKHPWLAGLMAAFLFSMAGIPPLAGFYGKFYVFLSAMQAGLTGMAVLGVLTSVVACFYYLKLVKVMYFDAPPTTPETAVCASSGTCCDCSSMALKLALLASAAVTCGFFLYPTPLVKWAELAAVVLVR